MKNLVLPPPISTAPEPSIEIQQDIQGDENQAIGSMTGGTAIAKIVGNVIYNYYYREELQTTDDTLGSAESDLLPCPYRGLFHFGPSDAEYFFGRENFVAELVKATQTRNFIPLLGASGSGKSSVVLAGLVPKLQQTGHWQFTHFRPGADPFQALALALVPLYATNMDETERIRQARNLAGYLRTGEVLLADVFAQIQQNFPGDRVLLIADQFEELYTLCTDETTRRNFLDRLLAGVSAPGDRIPFAPVVIATMRADFLGTALSYRPLADVLQNADLKLGPMNRAELTEAIEKPAQKLGVTFAAGLVERILDDVDVEPGILPLLEFALTELWQRRSGKQLTHAAYEEIGEVQGALGRHANEEYERLSDIDRERVRRIFIQLVRPGEGAEDTRRIATKAELGEQNWSLVKQLADTRLVVTSRNGVDRETVEVVHEALIRNWGELRGWMDTDRVFRAWQERLRGAMQQWQETQQDVGSLLRGAALVEAEEQLQQRPDDLVSESDFIKLSLHERERIQQAETTRRQREIKNARTITIGSLLAFVVSSGLGITAWQQTQKGEINLADSLSSSALAMVDKGNGLDAFITAIRAGKIQQNQHVSNPSGLEALQKALDSHSEYNRLEGHNDSVRSVIFSPDGKTLATASYDKTIVLWDIKTGKKKHIFRGHKKYVNSVSFSPNGKTLATGSDDTTVKLWNVATGTEIPTLIKGHKDSVRSVSFSRDGNTLATASDETIVLWDIKTGKKKYSFHSKYYVNSVSFSPDGNTLATGNDLATVSNETIVLWDIKTGKKKHTLQGHENSVNSVSFSPDGNTLASGSNDKTIVLWDIKTGKKKRTLQGHEDSVNSVSFSRDGETLASGSSDRTVKLWNVDTGGELRTLQRHQTYVTSVSFSRDGKTLATASNDKTIVLRDVKTGKKKHILKGHQSNVNSVSFSPDSQTLATGSDKNSDGETVKLWNVVTGEEIPPLIKGHQSNVTSVSFSPDGKTLATGSTLDTDSTDKTVKLWNVFTGEEIPTLIKGHQQSVSSVSFSPDGQTLATSSYDKTIVLWDIKTGKEKHSLPHQGFVLSMSFSPDGKTLAAGGEDTMVTLWNVETAKEKYIFKGHQHHVNSVSFSPDGKTLATGSTDTTIKLWSLNPLKEIRTLQGHDQSGVLSVSFSPDSKTLATGNREKTVELWDLDLDSLMGRSCDWVRVYLESNPNVSASDKRICEGIDSKKQ
jgi:WD40 repeat protein